MSNCAQPRWQSGWIVLACLIGSEPAAAATWFNTLPAAKQASILWKEDHETATNTKAGSWDNGKGTPWASGNYSWSVVTSPAAQIHSGTRALKSVIDTATSQSGVRWPMRVVPTNQTQQSLPTEAYYSFWFYLPQTLVASDWYMIQQWKTGDEHGSSTPAWSINLVDADASGRMKIGLNRFINDSGAYMPSGQWLATGTNTFTAGTWNHIETFYKHARGQTGAISVWLNGVQQFSRSNVWTEYNYPITGIYNWREYAVNAYGDGLNPNPHTLILDDAAISSSRLSTTLSTTLPGDYNRDGTVDAADFTVWRNNLGSLYTMADYAVWKSNFGRSSGGGSGSLAVSVPEPATLLLAGFLAACTLALRRWPKR